MIPFALLKNLYQLLSAPNGRIVEVFSSSLRPVPFLTPAHLEDAFVFPDVTAAVTCLLAASVVVVVSHLHHLLCGVLCFSPDSRAYRCWGLFASALPELILFSHFQKIKALAGQAPFLAENIWFICSFEILLAEQFFCQGYIEEYMLEA